MAASPQGVFTGSLPELYERFLVQPLFRPFALALLDRAGVTHHDRLLDVACGTGIVARLAQSLVGEGGRIVGIDASPAMLGMARSVAPTIDWREGDAGRLPVPDGETFDVVTCHQGLQFFPDKPAAAREMRRVLASGGRVAISSWCPVDDIPLMRDLQRVVEKHLGAFNDTRHSFGEGDAIRTLLAGAGFGRIDIETVSLPVRMAPAAVFPQLNTMAVMGMSAAAKAMGDEERSRVSAAIAAESVDVAQPYSDGDTLVFDLVTTVAIART